MPFQIDAAHSEIQFSARHMMVSKVRGVFEKWGGAILLNPANPGATVVDITIEAASISSKDEKRDEHLRSPDFLGVEQYPSITFKSTKVEVTGDNTAKLHGDLTIRDVTKPVVMAVEYQGNAKSPWGTVNYGFSATTKINREDWGLSWNAALETGGWLVGKEIQIDIDLELVQVAEPEKVAA
ncbi:YceI family protein [Caldilinea sp.]|uniref:YceI family protein n=1 Tax=Caldilinea sp. TaxID=2293560 RepID=UPI002BDD81A5|nr:YceI family protein [Anaerolineales bacterium]HQY93306.1 YceI family protein [Caldilinea sp.]HRA65624.1 YceI family protein [Caldilinea sp.]